MPKSPIRAAIYLRVSLDPTGEELAVTRQREDCLAIAAARGWPVVEEYRDNSVSASDAKKNRPDYDRMVADFARGRFNALVCWDLDRLTRQPRQLEDWIDAAEQRGLLLVTANGEADLTTDAGRLFARIKAAVARAEVERKGKRQARAQRQRAERGLPPAGVRLTGYTQACRKGCKLDHEHMTTTGELIPNEALLVEKIFARFAGGESLRAVAAWLQQTGIPTRRNGRWNPSTVRSILTNGRYCGQSVYKGEDTNHPGVWEPIVTPERFAAVQAILNDPRRKTNRRGQDRKYLGSGIYRCGICDHRLVSWAHTSETQWRYRCPDGHLTRAGRILDELVVELVVDRLRRDDLAELLARPEDSAELAKITAMIESARQRLVTIEADYDSGLIDGRRYATATDKVRAEIRDASREQATMLASSGPESILAAPDRGEAFLRSPLGIQRRMVEMLMEVHMDPALRGRKTFDIASVRIEWRVPA